MWRHCKLRSIIFSQYGWRNWHILSNKTSTSGDWACHWPVMWNVIQRLIMQGKSHYFSSYLISECWEAFNPVTSWFIWASGRVTVKIKSITLNTFNFLVISSCNFLSANRSPTSPVQPTAWWLGAGVPTSHEAPMAGPDREATSCSSSTTRP